MNDVYDHGVDYTRNFLSGYSSSDIFISTSLSHESVLALSILEEAGFKCDLYYVKTGLVDGDFNRNIDLVNDRFNHNLIILDVEEKKNSFLKGRDFMSIDESERRAICRLLKKDTLFDYVKKEKYSIWINGVRRVETKSRQSMKAISLSRGFIKFSPIFSLSDKDVYYILKSQSLGFLNRLHDRCKINSANECGLHL